MIKYKHEKGRWEVACDKPACRLSEPLYVPMIGINTPDPITVRDLARAEGWHCEDKVYCPKHAEGPFKTLGDPLRCSAPDCGRQCAIGDDDYADWRHCDGKAFCPKHLEIPEQRLSARYCAVPGCEHQGPIREHWLRDDGTAFCPEHRPVRRNPVDDRDPLRCVMPGCQRQCAIGDDDYEQWLHFDGEALCSQHAEEPVIILKCIVPNCASKTFVSKVEDAFGWDVQPDPCGGWLPRCPEHNQKFNLKHRDPLRCFAPGCGRQCSIGDDDYVDWRHCDGRAFCPNHVHYAPIIESKSEETVDHPPHYGGVDNTYETIRVIDAWQLDFALGNVVKYICRAGKKGDALEDLKKARWYLDHAIEKMSR